jgi:K+ transporter
LLALFMVQSMARAAGHFFGPITLVWFVAITLGWCKSLAIHDLEGAFSRITPCFSW